MGSMIDSILTVLLGKRKGSKIINGNSPGRLIINTNAKIGNKMLSSLDDNDDNIKFIIRDGDVVITSNYDDHDIDDNITSTSNVNSNNNIVKCQCFNLNDYEFDRIVVNGDSKFFILDTDNFADGHNIDIWTNDTSYTQFDITSSQQQQLQHQSQHQSRSQLQSQLKSKSHIHGKLVIYTYNNSVVDGCNSQVDILDIKTHDHSSVLNFRIGHKAKLNTLYGGNISVVKARIGIVKKCGSNITIIQ